VQDKNSGKNKTPTFGLYFKATNKQLDVTAPTIDDLQNALMY